MSSGFIYVVIYRRISFLKKLNTVALYVYNSFPYISICGHLDYFNLLAKTINVSSKSFPFFSTSACFENTLTLKHTWILRSCNFFEVSEIPKDSKHIEDRFAVLVSIHVTNRTLLKLFYYCLFSSSRKFSPGTFLSQRKRMCEIMYE